MLATFDFSHALSAFHSMVAYVLHAWTWSACDFPNLPD